MNNILRAVGCTLVALICHADAYSQPIRQLKIAVQAGHSPASKLRELLKDFSNETGIQVVSVVRRDIDYKDDIQQWLINGLDTPDVIQWHSSNRLFQFSRMGVLTSLTKLWKDERLEGDFENTRKSDYQANGEIWGIPFSHYHWGIYYKKSVLKEYGPPPKTWRELLDIARRMKLNGLSPFGLANREMWPAGAWFDYINLRMNGLHFHRKLLQGKISFKDSRVINVLTELKKAIDGNFFNQNLLNCSSNEVAPMLMRGRIGFTLMGNGISAFIPQERLGDIGFFPFPEITRGNNYEDNPMDVFIMPKNVKNKAEAELFLKYIARADVQSKLNASLGFLPANRRSKVYGNSFTLEGMHLIKNAKGLVQYFDRDTDPNFERLAMPILAEFMRDGDIIKFTELMETVRLNVLLK